MRLILLQTVVVVALVCRNPTVLTTVHDFSQYHHHHHHHHRSGGKPVVLDYSHLFGRKNRSEAEVPSTKYTNFLLNPPAWMPQEPAEQPQSNSTLRYTIQYIPTPDGFGDARPPDSYLPPAPSYPWTTSKPHLLHHHPLHPVIPVVPATSYLPPMAVKPMPPRDYFPSPSIIGLLQDEGAETFLSLLKLAHLQDQLSGEGPFTLFVPTEAAFDKVDPNLLSVLKSDVDLLRSVLLYHIVPRKLFSKNFNNDVILDTALGNLTSLRMNKDSHSNFATVNGVEIIQGKKDQTASNGLVHFIDELIYPVPEHNLLQLLSQDQRLSTFYAAVAASDLAPVLNGSSSQTYTVFSPTNMAFNRMSDSDREQLFLNRMALNQFVKRHVVMGTRLSAALTFADLATAADTLLTVRTRKGSVTVNGLRLLDGDIIATNGAIQIIDGFIS